MNLPKTGSMLRRLLIIIPVVVGLTLVSLFMPAQQLSIEGIGILSFETTVTLSVGSEVAYASPGWVSPTGFVDGGSVWTSETLAYDENTDTYAYANALKSDWTDYLELTHAALNCDKVQLWVGHDISNVNAIEVDVYYSLGWHNIFPSGAPTWGAWQEHTIGSTESVTALRVRFYSTKAGAGACWIHEADFNEVSLVPEITVDPTNYNFDVVAESSTPYTITTYFAIDNNSTMQTDHTIGVTTSTWSGGIPWDHAEDAVPGANTAGLLANRGGTWGTGDIIVKFISPNYIYENCPATTDYSFGLKLLAPTSFSDGVEKQIIVQITAVAG